MPQPVSTSNSPAYDPSVRANSCDPSITSCAEPQSTSAATPPIIELEPMVIVSDAATKQLVAEHRQRTAPSCESESRAAAFTCAAMAPAIANALVAAPSGLAAVPAITSAVLSSTNCSRLISAYDDCVTKGKAVAAEANACEASGGTAVGGPFDGEVVCLQP